LDYLCDSLEIINNMKNINEGTLTPHITGIDDVYMWIGVNKTTHSMRIKISNKKTSFDKNDNFSFSIPDYEVVAGIRNNKIINDKKIEKIKSFLIKIHPLIERFYKEEFDNVEFIIKISQLIEENKLNEYKRYKPSHLASFRDINLTDYDLEWLDWYNEFSHGIEDVIMWIGETSIVGEKVVKIANVPDPKCREIFTIYLDDMSIIGDPNKEIFTERKIHQIITFLSKNKMKIIRHILGGWQNDSLSFR
jgi:hypothetical protein